MPLQIKPQIMPTKNGGRFDITIHPRSTDGKPIEKIVLTLPMPKSTSSVNATCNLGQYMYDPVNKVSCFTSMRNKILNSLSIQVYSLGGW
jgi:AP-3 complex subunit mu